MARFDPYKYKIDKTSYGRLKRLSDKHLSEVLKIWSRTANQRVARARKLDPNYSYLYEFERGGRFGKSFVYKDRETMLNEIQRIKNVAGKMHAKAVRLERKEINRVFEEMEAGMGKDKDKVYISENMFRQAFAIFKSGRGFVPQSIYEKIRSVVLRMVERDLVSVVDLIYRMYDEFSSKYYSDLESLTENEWTEYETEDEDLPF